MCKWNILKDTALKWNGLKIFRVPRGRIAVAFRNLGPFIWLKVVVHLLNGSHTDTKSAGKAGIALVSDRNKNKNKTYFSFLSHLALLLSRDTRKFLSLHICETKRSRAALFVLSMVMFNWFYIWLFNGSFQFYISVHPEVVMFSRIVH